MTICMKCKWHEFQSGIGEVCVCNLITKTNFVTGKQIPEICCNKSSNKDGACPGFEEEPVAPKETMMKDQKSGFLSMIWESMTKTGGCCGSGKNCCGPSHPDNGKEKSTPPPPPRKR